MGVLLEMSNVTVIRGRTKVFDRFTLEIQQGCNTAIVGPNGAGKSTLVKLVSGEVRPVFSPDSYMKVFDKDRWNLWDLRSHLGIISHDVQCEYHDTVLGINVVLSGFYSSVDTWRHQQFNGQHYRKAEEVIELLGVSALMERPFGSMSTGEQRCFLLGRALVNDPIALLPDEPTSGLDPRASFRYRECIRDLMQTGTTVLLTTHHIHEIPPEIERVVLLKNGGLFADGSRRDMLTSRTLSALFDFPLRAVSVKGTCHLFPRQPGAAST